MIAIDRQIALNPSQSSQQHQTVRSMKFIRLFLYFSFLAYDDVCVTLSTALGLDVRRSILRLLGVTSADFWHPGQHSAFHHYVDSNTRQTRTMQTKEPYRAAPLHALVKSNHNLVLLKLHYKQRVRRLPTTIRSFRKRPPEAEQAKTASRPQTGKDHRVRTWRRW